MSAKVSKAVRDAIKDPFVLGDDAPAWTLPTELPPIAEVREALTALRADVEPTSAKDARWCLGKMRQRFGIGIGDVDAAAWLQALQGFPRNMIFEAVRIVVSDDKRPTLEGFTRHPGVVRRRTDLARTEAILAALMKPEPVVAFVRPPAAVRLRQVLAAAQRRGDTATAAKWERELAAVEQREPEAWAVDTGIAASASEVDKPAVIQPSKRSAAMMLKARARFWRDNRVPGLASRLEAEADALAPEHVDEPMGDEHAEEAA